MVAVLFELDPSWRTADLEIQKEGCGTSSFCWNKRVHPVKTAFLSGFRQFPDFVTFLSTLFNVGGHNKSVGRFNMHSCLHYMGDGLLVTNTRGTGRGCITPSKGFPKMVK